MNHLQEWGQSCVDDQVTRLNAIPLEGLRPYDYLLYSDAIPRRNDGRLTNPILKRYQHLEKGGWWCSGIDVLTGEYDLWGCFKPLQPRRYNNKKLIKYEHPPKTPTGLFALRVPVYIWQRIASRYNLKVLPTDINPKKPDLGFWQWLINNPSIPLCITEGAKKSGALLTAGFAAVALPGINGGYRVAKDKLGNKISKPRLIPQLVKLIGKGREIYLAFDQDSKPNTIKSVDAAIGQTGYLLTQAGCNVKVITWNSEYGKGVDDLIANQGVNSFELAYQNALALNNWKAKLLTRLTYPRSLKINRRYIGKISIPNSAKFIAIKSPKGTGKTKFLQKIVRQALTHQKPVLVIGHRVRLLEDLCQRFGIKYITEIDKVQLETVTAYGLCIDSLHPNSQASFNPANWNNAVVIIDEIEQVLWHGLNSNTCTQQRVAILKCFSNLMQNVLGGEGKVVIADADLSDIAIEYLTDLSGIAIEPFIIENEWQPGPQESWQVNNYTETTPERLVKDLENHIRQGGKPFVCLSAQKLQSQWGTQSLEAYLQAQFPLTKILRIDSESLANPNHPAYGCISKLPEILPLYDIVLASPSIETGVSIDLRGHFTSVWAIACGIQGENSVRQALGRLRENVPRFIWVAPYSFHQIGNGSTSIASLLASENRLTQLNITLLQQSDFAALDAWDKNFQSESLTCWAKMAVRFNASMLHYRESVLIALENEGHQVTDIPPITREINSSKSSKNSGNLTLVNHNIYSPENSTENISLTAAIAATIDKNYQANCDAIALAEELSDRAYQDIKKRLIKTTEQRHAQRKYELQQRYHIPVTAELVLKDDRGWYTQLQLHYYLTVGRPYLAERDAMMAKKLLELGTGNLFSPDFNRFQIGAAIGIMEMLGIPVLLADNNRELRNTDTDLLEMTALALRHRCTIKTVMGIGLANNNVSPITIIRRFLDKIGYNIKCIRYESNNKKRLRVYQIVNPDDGRFAVFEKWLISAGKLFNFTASLGENETAETSHNLSEETAEKYIQLCLIL